MVTREGFQELGTRVHELAAETSDNRFAIVQEGGYQISHLAFATLGVLKGATRSVVDLPNYGTEDPFAWVDKSSASLDKAIDEAINHHSAYWSIG